MFRAVIEIKGERAFLAACAKALRPEAEFRTARAHYKLKLDKSLKIAAEAADANALRAVMTTLTGLLSVAESAWKHGR